MNRYFKIVVLLVLPFLAFGQKFRQEIQDYNSVVNLRNETLAPKKNDKAFIQTTKHLYSYDWGNTTSSDDGLKYIVQTLGSYRWVCLNCHLRVELSQDSILLQYDANDILVQRDTIRLLKGADKFHSNIVGTAPYDPLLPLTGWVAPTAPIAGNTVEVKFTDGTVGSYTWDGAAWIPDFQQTWAEQRICLNTATPTFTPANLLMPTVAEVQAWTLANLTEKQRLNGTHVVYFIAGQGGDCDNPDYTWVLNQGSELVTRTQNSILTLPNYTALRNLTKYNHDIVIVDDWTYTGPDGNTYTTLGGIFKRTHERTITENGGTIIVATNGDIWERDWDGIQVNPDWWECGGYNTFGNLDINTPNELQNDNDRIINATNLKEGTKIVLANRQYIIDKSIQLKDNQKLDGNGAILKRKPMIALTYTANGTNQITVSNGSYFRAGNQIKLGTETTITHESVILSKSGNILTLNNSIPTSTNRIFLSLTTVSLTRSDETSTAQAISFGCEIYNVIFDGSMAATDYKYWDGGNWTITGNVYVGSDYPGLWIHKCKFLNIPQENIYLGSGLIENCYAENGNGSFVHFNSNNTENISKSEVDKKYGIIVRDNIIIDFCQTDQGHNEGVFTFSEYNPFVRIINNKIYGSNRGILGYMSPDDNMLLFEGNECHNAKTHIIKITSGAGATPFSINIKNNKFYSCGDIFVTQGSAGNRAQDVNITGNDIYNGRLYFNSVNNLNIENNTIAWVDGLYGFDGFNDGYGLIAYTGDGRESYIYLGDCFNVNIANNGIHGDGNSLHDDQYIHGILYYYAVSVSGTTVTDDKKFNISNNFISGFRKSISLNNYSAQLDRYQGKQVAFWSIFNNTIVMAQNLTSTGNYGIESVAGTEIVNNSIWMPNETTMDITFGILAHGPHTLAQSANMIGTTVRHNRIYGGISTANSASICVGYGGWNYYNNIVEGNITKLPILNNTSGKSYVVNNLLLSTIIPNYTTPPPTRWKFNYSTIGI